MCVRKKKKKRQQQLIHVEPRCINRGLDWDSCTFFRAAHTHSLIHTFVRLFRKSSENQRNSRILSECEETTRFQEQQPFHTENYFTIFLLFFHRTIEKNLKILNFSNEKYEKNVILGGNDSSNNKIKKRKILHEVKCDKRKKRRPVTIHVLSILFLILCYEKEMRVFFPDFDFEWHFGPTEPITFNKLKASKAEML